MTDAWKDKCEPWTEEPTGPDVGYMIRTSDEAGRSNGAPSKETIDDGVDCGVVFEWPNHGYVERRKTLFWSGLHGLLDGVGDWGLLPRHKAATWQILAVLKSECKKDPHGGAHRAPRGWVVYSGDAVGAIQFIIPHMARRGLLTKLSKFASGNAIEGEDRIRVARSGSCYSDVGDVAADGKGVAFTLGSKRAAVGIGADSAAFGKFGCAVTVKGGLAHAGAPHGDSIARASQARVEPSSLMGRLGTPSWSEFEPVPAACAGLMGSAVAIGPDGIARAGRGGSIFIQEWRNDWAGMPVLVAVFAAIVDDRTIRANTWYALRDGQPVQCEGPNLAPAGFSPYGYVPNVD